MTFVSKDQLLSQGETIPCPRCSSKALNITPMKTHAQEMAVFYCSKCGLSFTNKGAPIINSPEELSKIFSSGKDLRMTVEEALGGRVVSKETRALILSKVVSYGYDMWLAGFKQGLVASCTEEEWNGKNRNEQRGANRESEERGSQPNAGNVKTDGRSQ